MTSDNVQTTQTQQSRKDDQSPQSTGLARRTEDGSVSKQHRFALSNLPLSPYEMFRVNPFSLFRRMTENIDRTLQSLASEDAGNSNIAWIPAVEISEGDGNLRIVTELPGLSPNDVEVEVEDDALVLEGERKMERDTTEGGVRRSERQYGYFYRRIPLPEGANPDQAKAQFRNGMLEVTMPVASRKAERKQIQIETDARSTPEETKQAA